MLRSGPAARLTIHLPSTALWHHKPVYAEIVRRAHRAGLAGASVLHGVEGYGIHLRIHQDHPSRLLAHGPCAVVIVDDEGRVRAFLADLEDVLAVTGVAIIDRVEVYCPGGR
ncbi:DUF190 domain-containing protein [Streptomyces albicerus]|uniref:DUF190 domain-containing protein n=1 Tax=Streptomyces albicerus TaxID=2569859 RepID=UPI00124B5371|nr:DUF190 domain-containing protein [Streptomyces albicerus]